jgi:SAM-dependent methyltransferase
LARRVVQAFDQGDDYMATDIGAIERNLQSFYDFRDKSVIHVGAGGGQLIGYASITRSVLAVDIDSGAASRLEESVREKGLEHLFTIEVADILSISPEADVVFFELCLHEMPDPGKALKHAHALASNILIIDHHPDSPWAWYVCEEKKAGRSWNEVRKFNIAREASYAAEQHFDNYSDLLTKVEVMGETAIERIADFVDTSNIIIKMQYTIALIEK